MSHAHVNDLPDLIDSHADAHVDEERSGVRLRPHASPPQVIAFSDDEPTPVYVTINVGRCAAPRRYYVGTRFSTGIIAAEAWHEEMLFDGLSEHALASVADWLRARSL